MAENEIILRVQLSQNLRRLVDRTEMISAGDYWGTRNPEEHAAKQNANIRFIGERGLYGA
ncbi:MAG: hypothetical protein Q4B73_06190 [Lachnospiraceae bacterium]|nr:hypothetical protein [Lachnospiraceae bacterium]